MIEFLIGLAIGLVFACWIQYRANAYWIKTNISIYEGWATPDENGYLGYGRFPEPNRFPEVGGTMPPPSKVSQPVSQPIREGKTNKGGQNTFPSKITTRPPPPDPYFSRRQGNTISTKENTMEISKDEEITSGFLAGLELSGIRQLDGTLKSDMSECVLDDWPNEVDMYGRTYTLENVIFGNNDHENAVYV